MIRIKSEGGTSYGAQITTASGDPISGVSEVNLRILPNDLVRAEIEINVNAVDVVAHPLLGLDTIESAALVHGYKLVPLT